MTKRNRNILILSGIVLVAAVTIIAVIWSAKSNPEEPMPEPKETEITVEASEPEDLNDAEITVMPIEKNEPKIETEPDDYTTEPNDEAADPHEDDPVEEIPEADEADADEKTVAQDFPAMTKPANLPKEVMENPDREPPAQTVAAQVTTAPQNNMPKNGQTSGNKIYVEGFGWVDYNDPSTNNSEFAEGMVENGNKVGTFG